METTYLIDNFVHTEVGEPFRLFKFGKIYRKGKLHEVTPKSNFKLPHFKPAIKLGSHDPETPAGGFVKSLEVKADGIYAVPEYTDKGSKSIEEGDYKYNSPEVLWKNQGLEDPTTGEMIRGPMVVGVALLHTPHLGEATALYRMEPADDSHKELNMENEVVSVPILERVAAILRPEKVAEQEPEVTLPENYEEEQVELRELRVYKAEQLEADAKAESLSAVKKELDTEDFGVSFIELGKSEEAAEVLATMNDEQRTWVLTNFKALSKQIDESKLTDEKGNSGDSEAGSDAADAVIKAHMAEHEVGYVDAFNAIQLTQPEVFAGKE